MGVFGNALRGFAGVPEVKTGAFPTWLPELVEGTGLDGAVSVEQAVGLPAWFSVMRRLAGGLAMCPWIVYEGPREARERATGTWQWDLLHHRPGDGRTPGNLRADLASSLAASGNAYLLKVKVGSGVNRRVRELVVLDPRRVTPRREGGRIVFEDSSGDVVRTRTDSDVIHIRAEAAAGELVGVNPVRTLRSRIQTGGRRQRWEAAFFDNDARPGVALKFPERLSLKVAQQVLDRWNAAHQGAENAGRAAALAGGAELEVIPPVSLDDAQFVEAQQMGLREIAGLYGVPVSLVGLPGGDLESDAAAFVRWGLGPLFVYIEQALGMDRDLFPTGSGLSVEHLADALLRGTTTTRYEAYSKARQGGWMSVNELRGMENLPAVPGGDDVQLTPVGGAVDRAGAGGEPSGSTDGTEPDSGVDGESPPGVSLKDALDAALALQRFGLAKNYGVLTSNEAREFVGLPERDDLPVGNVSTPSRPAPVDDTAPVGADLEDTGA